MKLIHYSPKKITKLLNNYYLEKYGESILNKMHQIKMKPIGLWVSVKGKDDWKTWCKKESFRLDDLKYEYEVKLNKTANILHLKTTNELKEFTKKYNDNWLKEIENGIIKEFKEKNKTSCYKLEKLEERYFPDCFSISWNKLYDEYDGIIISPYQWDFRYITWYYGWDCASGCIWNINAVKEIKLINDKE